ncbi:MAG: Transcription regulator [contains diacylglycerol kinase catalytic domain], partial [uncultured Solirubrobacterales bacterium]
ARPRTRPHRQPRRGRRARPQGARGRLRRARTPRGSVSSAQLSQRHPRRRARPDDGRGRHGDGGRGGRRWARGVDRRGAAGHGDRARDRSHRPGQRPCARARDPVPARRGGGPGARGPRASDRRWRGEQRAVPGNRQPGLRLGGQPDRQRVAPARQRGLPVRGAQGARLVAPRPLRRDDRRRASWVHRLLGRGRQLEGLRRRHDAHPPCPARRPRARRAAGRAALAAALPADDAEGLPRDPRRRAPGGLPDRPDDRDPRRPPVRGLRRRRPDRRAAGDGATGRAPGADRGAGAHTREAARAM